MTTDCIINSIKLSPGESFILPPGASILSSSDMGSTQSECLDLSNVETMQCYVATLAGYNSGNYQYFEGSTQYVKGYELNGVFTAFDTEVQNVGAYGAFDGNAIIDQLKLKMPIIMYGDSSYSPNPPFPGANDGIRTYVLIQTIPSIGNKLKLKVDTIANSSDGTSNVQYLSSFKLLSDMVTEGYNDLPVCPAEV